MAAITWANVTDFAPTLSTVAADAQTAILAYVNTLLAVDEFDGESGPTTRLARIYLAAHLGTVGMGANSSGGGATAGPVIEEEVGDVRAKYGGSSAAIVTVSGLGLSAWGQLYLGIVRRSPARAVVVL